jgi:hypothetical protein
MQQQQRQQQWAVCRAISEAHCRLAWHLLASMLCSASTLTVVAADAPTSMKRSVQTCRLLAGGCMQQQQQWGRLPGYFRSPLQAGVASTGQHAV